MTIFSEYEIDEIRIEQWNIIEGLPTNRLKQLMGMINCYTYSIGSRYGAISTSFREDKTVRTVLKERLIDVVSACSEGLASVTTTVLWMRDYLTKHWEGACNSCPSIRKMRVFMRDALRLFDFTPQQKGETVVPPEIQQIDIQRMLITFEVCEKELLFRHVLSEDEEIGSELKSAMPPHLGALVVEVFNSLFDGITRYNRVDESDMTQGMRCLPTQSPDDPGYDVPTPPSHEVTQGVTYLPPVTWQWQHCFSIGRKLWANLAKKYQRVTGKKIEIDETEPVNWDKVAQDTEEWMRQCADIPY